MEVLPFSAGDSVCTEGETATFLGIVLAGELAAKKGGTEVKHYEKGGMLGEAAFIVGGIRQADIDAKTDGLMGLLNYNDLMKYAEYKRDTSVRVSAFHKL